MVKALHWSFAVKKATLKMRLTAPPPSASRISAVFLGLPPSGAAFRVLELSWCQSCVAPASQPALTENKEKKIIFPSKEVLK